MKKGYLRIFSAIFFLLACGLVAAQAPTSQPPFIILKAKTIGASKISDDFSYGSQAKYYTKDRRIAADWEITNQSTGQQKLTFAWAAIREDLETKQWEAIGISAQALELAAGATLSGRTKEAIAQHLIRQNPRYKMNTVYGDRLVGWVGQVLDEQKRICAAETNVPALRSEIRGQLLSAIIEKHNAKIGPTPAQILPKN
jgi:hypothetical protein